MTLAAEEMPVSGFQVDVEGYAGPFDVLLGMIANRRLEVTEVSLSAITEEFLAYVRRLGLASGQTAPSDQSVASDQSVSPGQAVSSNQEAASEQSTPSIQFAQHMDEASAFLDVASILVEAKSAALLPCDEQGERDEQSIEALRERDLLFARLVQYRAFKRAAGDFRARFAANSGRFLIRQLWMTRLRPCCPNWSGRWGLMNWRRLLPMRSPTRPSIRSRCTSCMCRW